jgi:NDP-sugar pyrophosphorylase family protein
MMKVDTAIVLAGGKGLRLMPLTSEQPKAMIPVLGIPMIEWVILWLKKNGITNIILSLDYKKEKLIDHLQDGKKLGVNIIYNDHSGAVETGDAFRSVFENIKPLPDVMVAMNGDQITDLSLKELINYHSEHDPIATMVSCPFKSRFGIVTYDENYWVEDFEEKPVLSSLYANAGIYVFNKKIAQYLPQRGAIETTTFQQLIKKQQLKTYVYDGLFTTVNDHKDLQNTETILKNMEINFI